MSGDQPPPECSEALEEAKTAAPAVRSVGAEHAAAVVEAWGAGGRGGAAAAGVAQAALLLAARIWLSQAILAVRAISQLYAASDTLGERVLPLGTRVFLATAIAGGTGVAMWPVPFTGELVTAPVSLLLLCWALLLGVATRPVALIL